MKLRVCKSGASNHIFPFENIFFRLSLQLLHCIVVVVFVARCCRVCCSLLSCLLLVVVVFVARCCRVCCSLLSRLLLSCLLLVVVVFVVRCCADCCCHAGLFLLRVYDSGFKCVFEYFVQMYTCDQIYLSTFCVHFLCNDILLQTEHFSVLFQLSTVTYDLYLLVEFSINFPVQNLTCITIPKLFS